MKNTIRILLASVALAPAGALAVPITVDFNVVATGRYDAGVYTPGASYAGIAPGAAGGGFVTFDDSVGSVFSPDGLPTLDLEFNWLGFSYTEADAQLFNAFFLPATNTLEAWAFGPTAPSVAGCALNCYRYPGPTDYWVVANNPAFPGQNHSHFHILGFDGAMYGEVTWSIRPANAVPEPATLGLFGLGLLGIAVTRRRRKA